ncbi:GNAT family N-acetyltransferase [Enterocloster asparagiformis]|uniref:GNAT family N-acetyltransferase n=1 Tax=Enterocloster asparagiformis TaxID=333367 RepID=UPI0004639C42|nr:GNAT family N-acetyltransferase [Enterocloster asparagiformis]
MDQVKIRPAVAADAAALLEIYAPYVRETTITFEYETPGKETFAGRIEGIAAEYPYLVCEIDGRIAAYAYGHRHMERAAYQWNAELSVYVDRGQLRRGIGRALYQAVMEILKLQNVQTVYGIVTSPNENSERLHVAMGFTKRALFPQMGYKFGGWLDVAWYEKNLGGHGKDMEPFKAIGLVDPETLTRIMENCAGEIAKAL